MLFLNVHYHTLVLDGVFAPDRDGTVRFHPAAPPTDGEVARLLATIVRRVTRLLRRRGLALDDDGPDDTRDLGLDEAPALAALSGASVRGRSLHGRQPGAPVLRVGSDPHAAWVTSRSPQHAHLAAFDLHANRTVRADDRAGLERLCHYLLRPPLAQDRLTQLADGRIGCMLAHPWSDGTRAVIFSPLELLEKLTALVPRPRVNLVVYHGVLAPHLRARSALLHSARAPAPVASPGADTEPLPPRRRHYAWADLLRRVFAVDVLQCVCGGRLRLIATIRAPEAIKRILAHLGRIIESAEPAAARPPPDDDGSLAFDFPG